MITACRFAASGLACLLWLAVFPAAALAPMAEVVTDNVNARLVAERAVVAPGVPVELALVLEIRPGWHTYWRNPGDSGEPPKIQWTLPEGVAAGPLQWPLPERIPVGPLANYGYFGTAVHPVQLHLPEFWSPGRPVRVVAEAGWLVCEEHCIPEEGRFELILDTAAEPGPLVPEHADWFDQARAGLPLPEPMDARIRVGSDTIDLAVRIPAQLGNDLDPEFFADEWGLINHAAVQDWERHGDWFFATLAAGDFPDGAARDGLLVLRAEDGERIGIELVHADLRVPDPQQAGAGPGLLTVIGMALLGGLILNLMPCVFPVLAIKVLGLVGQGGASASHRLGHGLAYTAGVLLFFALLGGLLLGLRSAGDAVGWGFQLQSPVFVALMAELFLVLGLSLIGALSIGGGLMSLGGGGQGVGIKGSFATGGLAALVAAPCTAPFMGAALGVAVTLPVAQALSIMLALGLGLALPFLLLSLWPGLARRLPRPGPWMERLKEFLAFPMFATSAWLIWVLSVQAGPDAVGTLLAALLLLAFGLWLLEIGKRDDGRGGALMAALGMALAIAAVLGAFALSGAGDRAGQGRAAVAYDTGSLPSHPFERSRLREARDAGRGVLVNMTAAWCITCKVNERVALRGDKLRRVMEQRDILYLLGDWTARDDAITAYLAEFGRSGVPLYVFYPEHADPIVLPQLLTESMVLEAIEPKTGI